MSFINYSSREINCKIVYYGPGLCGKTTNLQYIYNKTNPEAKGKMVSVGSVPHFVAYLQPWEVPAHPLPEMFLCPGPVSCTECRIKR